jgi:hypothetical protein
MNGECMRGQGASGSRLSAAPLTQARYFSHVEIFGHLQRLGNFFNFYLINCGFHVYQLHWIWVTFSKWVFSRTCMIWGTLLGSFLKFWKGKWKFGSRLLHRSMHIGIKWFWLFVTKSGSIFLYLLFSLHAYSVGTYYGQNHGETCRLWVKGGKIKSDLRHMNKKKRGCGGVFKTVCLCYYVWKKLCRSLRPLGWATVWDVVQEMNCYSQCRQDTDLFTKHSYFIWSPSHQKGRSFFSKTNHLFDLEMMEEMVSYLRSLNSCCFDDSQRKIGEFLTNS